MMNGVIDKTTKLLLRAGRCDFEKDGSFDAETELLIFDAPETPVVLADTIGGDTVKCNKWTGTEWELATP